MSYLIEIGIFAGITLALNQIVNLVYRLAARKTNAVHLRFSKSAAHVIISVIAIYSLAQQFEVTKDISKVLLQSGSLVIAIATFAAQQALGNVISGISLSASKPYSVGEKIKVLQGGTIIAEGIVSDVTIRHTIISQFNGETCIVPNSTMDSAVVINTNYTENVGNFVEVEISYDSDIEKAISIMRRICAENTRSLNTEKNAVTASGYTRNGIILKTLILTRDLNDNFLACSEIRIALVEEFRKNGIEIPYHAVTVHEHSAVGEHIDEIDDISPNELEDETSESES